MKTAIDTSVLYAILNGEPHGERWLDVLVSARREGRLVVCEIVYAELAPAFRSEAELQDALRKLGIAFEQVEPTSSWLAGQAFLSYRRGGGPRDHLIPDFLIAAHALNQADRLAAIDRGYLRRYFSDLPLLIPQG